MDELDLLEDEEEERVLAQYRMKRLAEMKAELGAAQFGRVIEISGIDYVNEVNKAGKDIWVVLHLYQRGWVHQSFTKKIHAELCVLRF